MTVSVVNRYILLLYNYIDEGMALYVVEHDHIKNLHIQLACEVHVHIIISYDINTGFCYAYETSVSQK